MKRNHKGTRMVQDEKYFFISDDGLQMTNLKNLG